MAKISAEKYEIKVGKDGLIILREPTNKEWNDFVAARYPMSKKNKVQDNSQQARAELFDTLLMAVENLEDTIGPITLETAKEKIPMRLKASIIFQLFEQEQEIDIKNS